MITLRSALPTPKEAWKNTSCYVRYMKRLYNTKLNMSVFKGYSEACERNYNIDKDYFYNDYVLPCIKIYGWVYSTRTGASPVHLFNVSHET